MTRTARNMRAYRARLAAGCRVIKIEVLEHELADLLVAVRIIEPNEADDLAALQHGLQEFLRRQFAVIANSMPGQYRL